MLILPKKAWGIFSLRLPYIIESEQKKRIEQTCINTWINIYSNSLLYNSKKIIIQLSKGDIYIGFPPFRLYLSVCRRKIPKWCILDARGV